MRSGGAVSRTRRAPARRPGLLPALGLAGVCSIFAGCEDDGTRLPRSVFRATHLVVQVELSQVEGSTRTGRAVLSGSLRPGLTAGGAVREVLDGRLVLLGDTLEPLPSSSPDRLRYEAAADLPASSFTELPIELRAPVVRGVAPSLQPRWSVFGRGGPDTLVVAPGEDLVLPVRVPAEPLVPWPDLVGWRVSIRETGGEEIAGYRGEGVPPSEVRVPAELLAGRSGEQLEAWLSGSYRSGREHIFEVTEPYAVSLAVGVTLRWPVRIER